MINIKYDMILHMTKDVLLFFPAFTSMLAILENKIIY